ncbi:hypothetical protein GCM10009858_31540 [Terrabacter carboxydivorans]|uniref:Secreted protein n=2 Tax=Terrabacter carboxydivorans TaxID=619730 RepID=A0ABP5Z7T1_9MICO
MMSILMRSAALLAVMGLTAAGPVASSAAVNHGNGGGLVASSAAAGRSVAGFDGGEAVSWSEPRTMADGEVVVEARDSSGAVVGKAGFKPGVKPEGRSSKSSARVATASGCDSGGGRDACIYVYGDGLYIDLWETRAYGNWGCSTAYYQRNGNVVASYRICPGTTQEGMYYSYWDANRSYHDSDQVCNQWSGSVARPCLWIEA